jgi:hypothetical protein
MEYGFGTAPVTASYFEFYAPKVVQRIILAEIKTITKRFWEEVSLDTKPRYATMPHFFKNRCI